MIKTDELQIEIIENMKVINLHPYHILSIRVEAFKKCEFDPMLITSKNGTNVLEFQRRFNFSDHNVFKEKIEMKKGQVEEGLILIQKNDYATLKPILIYNGEFATKTKKKLTKKEKIEDIKVGVKDGGSKNNNDKSTRK